MRGAPPTQLISYIAPSAPATRRPASGDEAFLRPEVGFTPKWYHEALGADFGQRWHTDPAYRRDAIVRMGRELRRRFPRTRIGWVDDPAEPSDLLTGVFGTCCVSGIYGVPIVYAADRWPTTARRYLSDEEVGSLRPPDLDADPFFGDLMQQVEWIASANGRIEGFVNWQGVLNNAYRLRGEHLFADMVLEPGRARRVFECVTTTMIQGAGRLYERQRESGVDVRHFTVSNCLVNMVSPQQYRDLLLPFDRRIAREFGSIGIHNCAWNADAYVPHYAAVPNVAYIGMGMESDLAAARQAFPAARRAIMYRPTDLTGKTPAALRHDLERVARNYGPCDLVFADIEWDTPDERVLEAVRICDELAATAKRPPGWACPIG